MNDILNLFARDRLQIIYRPELRQVTGSVTATILLQQIFYRWCAHGEKPFYKFKEHCGHVLCKYGDSWTEELGFSRKEFDTALKKIGQKLTKGTTRNDDIFVWYWTTQDRLTYYDFNVDAFTDALTELYKTAEPDFSKIPNGTLLTTERDFRKIPNGTLHIHSKNTSKNTSKIKATREKKSLEKVSELNNEIANGETAFTAPAPVNGATLFVGFCQENGFKRLLSWPKPLNDQRFHQLKDQHGTAAFTAELAKMNEQYTRAVKDCHRTVLNWFKRLQPPPAPHVETCYQIWRDGYRQKHGLYPTSSKYDYKNIEQMTAELAAMQPDQNVVDVWRQWCDMLFTMKPEGKNGFSWSPQLLTALSKNFSKITLDMKKHINGGSLQSQAEKDADFMAEAMQEYERLQREKQNKYA